MPWAVIGWFMELVMTFQTLLNQQSATSIRPRLKTRRPEMPGPGIPMFPRYLAATRSHGRRHRRQLAVQDLPPLVLQVAPGLQAALPPEAVPLAMETLRGPPRGMKKRLGFNFLRAPMPSDSAVGRLKRLALSCWPPAAVDRTSLDSGIGLAWPSMLRFRGKLRWTHRSSQHWICRSLLIHVL